MDVQRAKAEHTGAIRKLHTTILPNDHPIEFPADSLWFVVIDGGEVVAYAGLRYHPRVRTAELLLSGVRASHRGKGLQRRLIAARERAARRAGMTRAITYTVPWNGPSATNLAKARYHTFKPQRAWATRQVVYWEKTL